MRVRDLQDAADAGASIGTDDFGCLVIADVARFAYDDERAVYFCASNVS